MIIRDSSSFNMSIPGMSPDAGQLRIGIIRDVVVDEKAKTYTYGVEAYSHGRRVYMRCRQLSSLGDVWNFEEWNIRAFSPTSKSEAEDPSFTSKTGEVVVVAAICGLDMDGVIVGSLLHPSRESKLVDKEFAYYKSYNGLETIIDNDGAYSITYNGVPTNTSSLENSMGSSIPKPEYDKDVAGTYIKVLKDGSVEISDASTKKLQTLKIDKTGNKTTITSGEVILTLDSAGTTSINTKKLEMEATDSASLKTGEMKVEAQKSVSIKAPKIAIGTSGVELLDTIVKLIDAIGAIVVNAPNGPCQPVKTSPMWAQVEAIKAKISSIKGSL